MRVVTRGVVVIGLSTFVAGCAALWGFEDFSGPTGTDGGDGSDGAGTLDGRTDDSSGSSSGTTSSGSSSGGGDAGHDGGDAASTEDAGPPTTCAEANNAIGCCYGTVAYTCNTGPLTATDCSQVGQPAACGWGTWSNGAGYDCIAEGTADAAAYPGPPQYPRDCP